VTEFAVRGARDGSAEHVRHQLHAVADAERGHTEFEDAGIAERRIVFGHAFRAARQNQSHRRARGQNLDRRVERENLGVDRQLAQAARDQLRELRAEIQHEDRLMRHQFTGDRMWEPLL
jgi:hypothetical protein